MGCIGRKLLSKLLAHFSSKLPLRHPTLEFQVLSVTKEGFRNVHWEPHRTAAVEPVSQIGTLEEGMST